MSTPTNPDDVEYYLIPLDPAGEYITTAEQAVKDHKIAEFVQTVRPSVEPVTEAEQSLLGELQALLPPRIHLPEKNPFLTLQVKPRPAATLDDEKIQGLCACQCGTQGACSGGGNGS